VITATPQTVWNDYRKGLVRLEEFALLVFDECHRSRSRYAYTRLAGEYVRRCPYPLILALTASPGSEEEKVIEVVRNLWIEQIVWTTEEDDEEVAKYIPGIKASWVRVALPEQYEAIRQVIKRMIETLLARLRIDGLSVPEEVHGRGPRGEAQGEGVQGSPLRGQSGGKGRAEDDAGGADEGPEGLQGGSLQRPRRHEHRRGGVGHP
jgi:ERCC4-related helicase